MISFFRCKKYLGIDVANVDLFLRAFLCYAYVEFWLLKSASFLEVHLSSVKPAGCEGQLSRLHGGGFLFRFRQLAFAPASWSRQAHSAQPRSCLRVKAFGFTVATPSCSGRALI